MFNNYCENLKNENCAHCNKGEETLCTMYMWGKNHIKTCECMSEVNIVMMDECFWINAPQWCAWKKYKNLQDQALFSPHCQVWLYIYSQHFWTCSDFSHTAAECFTLLLWVLTSSKPCVCACVCVFVYVCACLWKFVLTVFCSLLCGELWAPIWRNST